MTIYSGSVKEEGAGDAVQEHAPFSTVERTRPLPSIKFRRSSLSSTPTRRTRDGMDRSDPEDSALPPWWREGDCYRPSFECSSEHPERHH